MKITDDEQALIVLGNAALRFADAVADARSNPFDHERFQAAQAGLQDAALAYGNAMPDVAPRLKKRQKPS